MKKFLFFASLATLGLMMGACSNEIDAPMPEGDGTVTFTAQLPASVQSRYGEGTSATQLRYAVYEADTKNVIFTSEVAENLTKGPDATYNNDLTFTLKLNLVKGKTYDLVFWAQNADTDAFTFSPADQTITVNYDNLVGNDEARDAFFNKVQGLLVKGTMQKTIELYRPFAQLNIATRDLEVAEAAGVKHKATSVTVADVPTVLDLVKGTTSGTGEMTVPMHTRAAEAPTTILEDDNTTVKAQYHYLSMNYILTGTVIPDKEKVNEAQKENKDVTITFNDSNDQAINTFKMSAVPFQRNYRTNIYGALLTSEVDYTIEIKPDFTDLDYNIEYVDTPQALVSAFKNGGKIVVTEDMVVPENILAYPGTETIVEIGDHKVDFQKTAWLYNGAKVTITGDGGIITIPSNAHMFCIQQDCELTVEGLTLSYPEKKNVGNAIFTIYDNGSKLTVKDCVLVPQTYAISTNATDPNQSGDVYFENVQVKQHYPNIATPVLINIPLNFTAKNCIFEGANHAAMLRGGNHEFENCTFNLTLDTDENLNCIYTRQDVYDFRKILNLRQNWYSNGDAAPIAAVLCGNRTKDDHYRYPTYVKMTGCTVNIPEVAQLDETLGVEYSLPAVYVYANQEEGMGVTFDYDNTTVFNGALEFASDNIIVNGETFRNYFDD